MGRIADSVLALLAGGPLGADRLGDELARSGATRARDPAAAVRRAVRDDPRVVQIPDGRLASVAQALTGVALAVEVTAADLSVGRLELGTDLAPLAVLGVEPAPALPRGVRRGETLVVRIDDPVAQRIVVERGHDPRPRADDEAAVVAAVAERLAGTGARRPDLVPPITHLGEVVTALGATRPDLLRSPGRPLSRALEEAGYEGHLGWVGPPGTAWESLTEEEVDALEGEVAELQLREQAAAAAATQARLVDLLVRHLPDRAPAARRRLARMLSQAGRRREALERLRAAFDEDDPENWYEAALIAYREGDEVSARRWVETGLAHAPAGSSEVGECLADMAGDLDAQAAFQRGRAALARHDVGVDPEGAERVARALVDPARSYLVEAMAEEVVAAVGRDDVPALVAALAGAGEAGREACLALATVLPPEAAGAARDSAGRGARARRDHVVGLMEAHPVAAWATSPMDAPDQQQLVITIAKERGRVSPLVVLIDLHELGGAVKDAFFLPDMVEARLRRELFAPMEATGLPPGPVALDEAIALVQVALLRTAEIGWRIPSLRHQPVLDRIERWLLRPQRGDAGRRPVAGS